MTDKTPVNFDDIKWTHIIIENGIQPGPACLTGSFGTRLDYTNAGKMTFWVSVVDDSGGCLTLYDDASYEAAIIEAERGAADYGVPVHDNTQSPDNVIPFPNGGPK